jgi:hypothetical protein
LRDALVHLALEPDKGLVFVFQALLQLGQRHFKQAGQLAQLRGRGVHVFRNGPDAGRGHAGGQQQAVAVQDAPAVGRQFQRAGKAHLALLAEKVVADDLHPGGTRRQAGKSPGRSPPR